MLKNLLAQKNVTLTKELSDMVAADIKFNNINFGRKTSLEDLLVIATRCDRVMKR